MVTAAWARGAGMPTYEYRCSRCQYKFETVHGVGETVDRCERCGGPVRRVFSAPALIFKGPGFHVNDYRKTARPSEGDGKASGTDKDADKSKPAAKSEAKSTAKTSGTGGAGDSAPSAGNGKKAS
jgi:putative FmdB family regulatory protein